LLPSAAVATERAPGDLQLDPIQGEGHIADPDREIVKAFGIEQIPAFLHFRQDLALVTSAEGWDPPAWREVTDGLSKRMAWSKPLIPALGDPAPYEGSPALL
jgi:hypothetical protein